MATLRLAVGVEEGLQRCGEWQKGRAWALPQGEMAVLALGGREGRSWSFREAGLPQLAHGMFCAAVKRGQSNGMSTGLGVRTLGF